MRRDLQHAVRTLARSPGYTLAALLTLALGIGTTTAVLSAVRSVVLEPLPYAPPDRAVMIVERDSAGSDRLASYPTFQDWHSGARSFEALAFVRGLGVVMKTGAGAERLVGAFVTDEFFHALPQAALVGRTLAGDDWRPGAPAAVVLSHDLWRRRFGGDRSILGRGIVLGERSYTVVGVLPPSFVYPTWADLYAPITPILPTDSALQQRGLHVDSRVVGRLRPGTDTATARRELSAVAARLATAYPAESGGWRSVGLHPVAAEILGDIAPQLRLLAVAALLVLLIGCVNVANLSLARASTRSRELAIRTALGAGRGALLRLLTAESVVLALGAGVLGLAAALGLIRWIKVTGKDVLPRVEEISPSGGAVALSVVVCLLIVTAFGLLPALRALSGTLSGELKDGSGAGTGRSRHRLRAGLVVAELALSLVLLAGAGLLFRSLERLQQVKPGFQVGHLVAVPIDPPSPRYDDPARALALYRSVAEAAAEVPGVEGVALTNHVPLSGSSMSSRIEIDGAPADPRSSDEVLFREVDAGYFRTVGTPLLAGRDFSAADLQNPGDAVLINQFLARRYWPGRNPVGRRLTVFKSAQGRADFGEPVRATVVGVVGDVRHFGLEADLVPEVYLPYTVTAWPRMSLLVRARGDPATVVLPLKRAVAAVDPDIPLAGATFLDRVYPLTEALGETLEYRRLLTGLQTAFALPALLLAGLGIYGVIAYLVSQRGHEIGVRMALGASSSAVLRLVLGQGLRLVLLGAGLGLLGALAGTRLLQAQLFGVTPNDPVTLLGSVIVLVLVGLFATYLPARRAARVDPMRALRAE
jgi:putative ABC transport system permease protein